MERHNAPIGWPEPIAEPVADFKPIAGAIGGGFEPIAEQQVNRLAIGLKTEVQERKEDIEIYITYYPITPTPAHACITRVHARTRDPYDNRSIGFTGPTRAGFFPDARGEPHGTGHSFTRLSDFSWPRGTFGGHGGYAESKVSTVAFLAPGAPGRHLARSSRPPAWPPGTPSRGLRRVRPPGSSPTTTRSFGRALGPKERERAALARRWKPAPGRPSAARHPPIPPAFQ